MERGIEAVVWRRRNGRLEAELERVSSAGRPKETFLCDQIIFPGIQFVSCTSLPTHEQNNELFFDRFPRVTINDSLSHINSSPLSFSLPIPINSISSASRFSTLEVHLLAVLMKHIDIHDEVGIDVK